jgi:hypothetical protein
MPPSETQDDFLMLFEICRRDFENLPGDVQAMTLNIMEKANELMGPDGNGD